MHIHGAPSPKPHPSWAWVVFLILLGCMLPQLGSASKQPDAKKIEHQAVAIMQGIMQGITEGDYHKYTKDFSEAMRKSVDHESFLQLQSNLRKHVGKFKAIDYLGFYIQEGFHITLFKAKFTKVQDDVLVKLVLEPSHEPRVTGLWFDAPSLRTN